MGEHVNQAVNKLRNLYDGDYTFLTKRFESIKRKRRVNTSTAKKMAEAEKTAQVTANSLEESLDARINLKELELQSPEERYRRLSLAIDKLQVQCEDVERIWQHSDEEQNQEVRKIN